MLEDPIGSIFSWWSVNICNGVTLSYTSLGSEAKCRSVDDKLDLGAAITQSSWNGSDPVVRFLYFERRYWTL